MTDASSITPVDPALMPAAVRNGSKARKADYQAALQFERMLVGQLTQSMSKSMGSLTGSGDDDDDSTGDAASNQLKQTIPTTLADSIMSSGGLGIAAQLDQVWHPNATSTSLSDGTTTTADGGGAATGGTGSGSA